MHDNSRSRVAHLTTRLLCRGALLIAVCSLLLGAPPLIGAENEETAEYPVKLAFLYQFAQYIQWPPEAYENATAPLVVCVVGGDPFDPDLEQELLNHAIDKHLISIRSVKRGANLRFCQMVFVPALQSKQAASVIDSLRGSPVLTIGETKGFAERGGIINFIIEQNKLHFEINLNAAKQTPLSISSKVLALARIVRDPPHP
jgi:hypothetical protein